MKALQLLVLSDVHFAGAGERSRRDHEAKVIGRRWLRGVARAYRHFVWLRDPYSKNHLLESVIAANPHPDLVVANGDFTLDTAFIGISDDAAYASASECLGRLRSVYGGRFHSIIGDHELGKMSLFGGVGGPRLASWFRAVAGLRLEPCWRHEVGNWVLAGVTSSLLALPLFEPEILRDEWSGWMALRERHLEEVRSIFASIRSDQRLILFCHDPSALPFLAAEPEIREKLDQVGATVLGHLHSPLVYRTSRMLAGMPTIRFAGSTARRLSTALNRARCWKPFRVVLCPALSGIELLKDGGFLTAELDLEATASPAFRRHRMPARRDVKASG